MKIIQIIELNKTLLGLTDEGAVMRARRSEGGRPGLEWVEHVAAKVEIPPKPTPEPNPDCKFCHGTDRICGTPYDSPESCDCLDMSPKLPTPELSRFLPEGWIWRQVKNGGNWLCGPYAYSLLSLNIFTEPTYWHKHGLLHPREGGGFQKHTPDSSIPVKNVDILWAHDHVISHWPDNNKNILRNSLIEGWRPHFGDKDGN